MASFQYTPDEGQKVHHEGAIRLLCKPFQSHENGLPEWPKNAADEYARRDTPAEDRNIILAFADSKGGRPPAIACVDFAGMSSDTIEEHFRYWASPDASKRGKEVSGIQGGHGNGGKCYMTRMFRDHALLHAALNGLGNRYGVAGGSTVFGYVPDPAEGRDYPVSDLQSELASALVPVGLALADLPQAVREKLGGVEGFTVVLGVRPRDYKARVPAKKIVDDLIEHPQMIRTLQLCRVYALHNGEVLNGGEPLSPPQIAPMPGAGGPRAIRIPEHLRDPVSGVKQSTTEDGTFPEGEVVLRTSQKSMRWSKKARHSVVFEAQSDYIGYVPVPELDIQSPFRDRIYGVCRLDVLEPCKQNDRGRLAETPLTRAVERFIAHEIEKYAKEFEAREKRAYDSKERNAVSRINEALDRWKNQFLQEMLGGAYGGKGHPPPPPPLPAGNPHRIDLVLPYSRIGRGVSISPTLRFYNKKGQRIRSAPFRWVSDDTNVAMVDDDLNVINTFSFGETAIYAEVVDGKVRSNAVHLEVVQIHSIRIAPTEVEVEVGGRSKLQAICTLADGTEATDVYLIWTENDPSVARVSASGVVFGAAVGQTAVEAADEGVAAQKPAVVNVSEGSKGGAGKGGGTGMPRVFVSGPVDPDPDTGEYVNFSADDPPVWRRPTDYDRGIWWINSSAPLAKLYLDKAKGYGYDTREWRMYHLERYIDVIVQIAMSHGPNDESMTADEWIVAWGAKVAEIQSAVASDLQGFIETGTLPQE